MKVSFTLVFKLFFFWVISPNTSRTLILFYFELCDDIVRYAHLTHQNRTADLHRRVKARDDEQKSVVPTVGISSPGASQGVDPCETFKVGLYSIFMLHAAFRTPLPQPDTSPSNCLHVSAHQLSIPLFLSFLKKEVTSKQSLVVKLLGSGVTLLGFESHLYLILGQNDTYSSLSGMVHFYTNCLSILCSQCLLYSKKMF